MAGEDNPADLASRGIDPGKLQDNNLWWNGPNWLNSPEACWPKQPNFPKITDENILIESKLVAHICIREQFEKGLWYRFPRNKQRPLTFLKAYGSFDKLKRVMATILRAMHNFKNKDNGERITGPLKREELRKAMLKLIQLDQQNTFHKELQLQQDEKIERNATIWYDKQSEILRLNGRVRSDNLSFDEQYPILLSPTGDLATLIIRQAHLLTLHGGVQHVLQTVRQQFWIYKARQLAKTIILRCPTCFRYRIQLSKQ